VVWTFQSGAGLAYGRLNSTGSHTNLSLVEHHNGIMVNMPPGFRSGDLNDLTGAFSSVGVLGRSCSFALVTNLIARVSDHSDTQRSRTP
jgi:hypothetical protein